MGGRLKPTIYLFDIDGTLISSGSAARSELEKAFVELTGCPNPFTFSFAGMTDRAIMRNGLMNAGLEAKEHLIDQLIDNYLAGLEAGLKEAQIQVHPGVLECLERAHTMESAALGLGTGNVERGARCKLAPVRLNHYFEFGGFGCDAEARDELVRIGLERGASALGAPKDSLRCVVIGDTPKDIWAAHSAGATCLGVATGGASASDLKEAGAECVVKTLESPEAQAFLFPPQTS
jgi:phosphoglycolate phosphatase-like HAD superfamily hydrolase